MSGETDDRPREPACAKKVEAATPRERDYKLADAGGLYLFVSTSVHRTWRLKYRFGGKKRRLVLSVYPEVGLKRARELRDDAKQALRGRLDPSLERTRARHSRKAGHLNTFEKFAREWHESQVPRWKPVHADDVVDSMEQNLFSGSRRSPAAWPDRNRRRAGPRARLPATSRVRAGAGLARRVRRACSQRWWRRRAATAVRLDRSARTPIACARWPPLRPDGPQRPQDPGRRGSWPLEGRRHLWREQDLGGPCTHG